MNGGARARLGGHRMLQNMGGGTEAGPQNAAKRRILWVVPGRYPGGTLAVPKAVPEAGPQNRAKRWILGRRYRGGTWAVPGRYPRQDRRMLQNTGSGERYPGSTRAVPEAGPQNTAKRRISGRRYRGDTRAVPGRYPRQDHRMLQNMDPVSGTRAVPRRYLGGTLGGT